ncbi:MAG: tyrosine decarboxylase MfnA [Methanobacteriaceae archaeon]|nr:tyrosine decarboxylase MfnA [Methanobacteriaceae archaeon]MDO9627168.1 tyrosine decarboxylase MfnA [Methanobacteriaceae archaeon]
MDKTGLSKCQVFETLQEFKKKDLKYSSGKILGSMCTCAHPIAKEVYCDFLESNLGDPGLFKGTKALENEVISMLGELLGKKDVYGHVITGGTEANLMAMRAARNMVQNTMGEELNGTLEIVVPKSAHFSFKKAADILGLKLKEVELTDEYRMDLNCFQENLSKNTIAVVGVAGTTELGKIDPISELSKICLDSNIYLHVDAAFGGFLIPFLKEIGYKLPDFDFSLEGVSSITIDPHKMGLAPIPSGCILFREKEYLDVMNIDTPYLTEKQQSTIAGTRTGASSAATWAVMKYMGREGYAKLAARAMEITDFLASNLVKAGFELVSSQELNIVAFNSKQMLAQELAEKLEAQGWAVSISSCPPAIRVVLMPHIKREHIIEFMDTLENI